MGSTVRSLGGAKGCKSSANREYVQPSNQMSSPKESVLMKKRREPFGDWGKWEDPAEEPKRKIGKTLYHESQEK